MKSRPRRLAIGIILAASAAYCSAIVVGCNMQEAMIFPGSASQGTAAALVDLHNPACEVEFHQTKSGEKVAGLFFPTTQPTRD